MDELEKMKKAKTYITLLSGGIDPVTNQPVTANTMKNPVIIDCLKYICDILRNDIQTCANKEFAERQKIPIFITDEQIAQLRTFKNTHVTVNKIAEEIERVIKCNGTMLFQGIFISNWLASIGMLERSDNGRKATQEGIKLGISSNLVHSKNNNEDYYLNTFNTEAQKFIYDHIREIIEANSGKSRRLKFDMEKLPDDKTIRQFITQSKGKCFIMSVGHCNASENIGSYRVAMFYNQSVKILERQNIETNSSNKCILYGLLEASKAIKKPTDVVIITSTNLGFCTAKSVNYYLCAEILNLLKKANCKVSLCTCYNRAIEFNQLVNSLRETQFV